MFASGCHEQVRQFEPVICLTFLVVVDGDRVDGAGEGLDVPEALEVVPLPQDRLGRNHIEAPRIVGRKLRPQHLAVTRAQDRQSTSLPSQNIINRQQYE